ncbi:MAG: glycosyltransferase [Caldimicrobium sp.]
MKLVDITPYFHAKSGGIKRYLLEKSKYLANTKIKHVLIIPGKKNAIFYYEKTKIYALKSIPLPLSGGYRFFLRLKDIKNILELEKPQIVELGGTYLPIPYLKTSQYKLIVFYHSDVNAELSLFPFPPWIKERFAKFVFTNYLIHADLILTPSSKQKIFLKKHSLENIKTVNLGINEKVFNFSKAKEKVNKDKESNGRAKVLYVGRLSPEKNINLLIKLIKFSDSELFHFIIAGDGPMKDKILKLSKKISNITYLDYIKEDTRLANLYRSSDIFVSPSTSETYGLTFLEAQACGCPLVAFDLNLETQPFKEFLVKEKTEEAFYDALIRAKNKVSIKLREEISSYILKTFSWNKTFENLLKIYSDLV